MGMRFIKKQEHHRFCNQCFVYYGWIRGAPFIREQNDREVTGGDIKPFHTTIETGSSHGVACGSPNSPANRSGYSG